MNLKLKNSEINNLQDFVFTSVVSRRRTFKKKNFSHLQAGSVAHMYSKQHDSYLRCFTQSQQYFTAMEFVFICLLHRVFLEISPKWSQKTESIRQFYVKRNSGIQKVQLLISNLLIKLIIYTKKLLNSDWLRKQCSSSETRVQNV